MSEPIYVILIDGRPYMKENAIRTYKTRKRANKEALNLVGYTKKYSSWLGRRITTAVYAATSEEEVAD